MLIFRTTLHVYSNLCTTSCQSEHSVKDDDDPSSIYVRVCKSARTVTTLHLVDVSVYFWCSLKAK